MSIELKKNAREPGILAKFDQTVRTYRMFSSGEKVLVAVSGGPDSVALLFLLKRLESRLGLELAVAAFDHKTRKNSTRDFLFVQDLTRRLQLPFYGGERRRMGRDRVASEDALRRSRYDFLLKTARAGGFGCLALGHTQDDQAETVLLRLLRGSGLWGLSAILPVRVDGKIRLVRPLIEISKFEIVRFLKDRKIAFRTDETNASEHYRRNRLRRRILPALEKEFNPHIRPVLARLALTVGADYDYLASRARRFLEAHSRREKGSFVIRQEALKQAHVSLRRLVLRMCVAERGGYASDLAFRHWQECEALLFERPSGSRVFLPGGWIVSKGKTTLKIYKR